MVSDGKVHMCGRCGEELLGRAEVEAMVDGRKRVYIPRHLMQWNTYISGSAYMYAEVRGQTGSRGEVKNIMCGCTAEKVDTPSMRMIRPEFRDHVRSVFGDILSVPMLFKLPLSVVAWENSGLVKTIPSENGLMVSDEGLAIIDIIADMSRVGLFNGVVDRFTVGDVMSGFTYLHVIKPCYRSFVAADYGSATTLAELLACVPLDWFDWQRMLTLRCDVDSAGAFVVSPVAGVSLVSEIVRLVVAAGKAANRPVLRAFDSVCNGSFVTFANTCVQFMPAGDLPDEQYAWATSDAAYPVDLVVGDSFLPIGPVVLQGRYLAVTFEPGVTVLTPRGTHVTAHGGAVTVFLNGSVAVELCNSDRDKSGYGFTANGMSTRMFQVHATCESYANGTALGRWHAKRFDVLSTMARFNAPRAELVLLSYAKIDCGDPLQALKFIGGTVADRAGVGVQYCEWSMENPNDRYLVMGPAVLGGGIPHDYGDWHGSVNGVITFGENVALGILSSAVVTFHRPVGWRPLVRNGDDLALTVSLKRIVSMDDYVIDDGGLSGTDGEYRDETSTHVGDVGLSVLSSLRYSHQNKFGGNNVLLYDKMWDSQVFGLGYTVLGIWPATLARLLGVAPKIQDILELGVASVDIAKLSNGGWLHEAGCWHYVDHDYQVSWEALIRGAVYGLALWKGSGTVMSYLLELHGLSNACQMTLVDRCA